MKLQFLVFSLLVLLSADYGLAASKSLASNKVSTTTKPFDKTTYPKKVSTLKKRPSKPSLKKVADITDKFKDLPADDLAFIKELDKQFKLHGGKVKIKVENDNVTMSTGKNSKRTIEGELGYGYSHNGYDYSPPKYMFYPYSQSDIAHDAPKYFLPDGKTEVSIEPSYSYELKPQAYVSHSEPQVDLPQPEEEHQQHQQQQPQPEPEQVLHHQQQQKHYEEPVIVLRIPGPAKYASHLQTLLQQYLEIRAAQYLRILEEAEQRQQHQQHQLQQVDYGQGQVEQEQEHYHDAQQQPQPQPQHQSQPETQIQHEYQPQQQLQYEQPQPAQYPDIDDVYQHYKHRHSSQMPHQAHQPEQQEPAYYVPEQQQEQHYVPEPQHQHQQQQPQFYYTHEQQYAQPEGPPANTYQHIYLLSMAGQSPHAGYEPQHSQPELQQPVYVAEQEHEQGPAQVQVQYEEHAASALSENNPRSSHTKVIFTHNPEQGGADYSNLYPLPSIKPNERHSPKSVPDYHQDYQEQTHPHTLQQEPQETVQQYQQQQQQQQHDSSATAPEAAAHQQQQQQVVAITQRPFNYHAHGVKPRGRGRGGHKRRSAAAAVAIKNADEKIREYVREKFGAQMGSAAEFKTTQVIEA